MIPIHKNLKKHFHEGVVYEKDGKPLKLMISHVNYGCTNGDPNMTFNLVDRFEPRLPMNLRCCYGRVVLFEKVPPEQLFQNLTEYRKAKMDQNKERIEVLKSKIEAEKSKIESHRKSISKLLETGFYSRILNDNFIKSTKEYQEGKKMTLPIFKSFFENLGFIDKQLKLHDKKIADSKAEIQKAENELKQLKDFNLKALRKQNSFEARKKWNLEHGE